jgi:hypothetical protein
MSHKHLESLRRMSMAVWFSAVAAGCAATAGYESQPAPLPEGCPADNPPSTAAELDACLTELSFDPLEAAGDQQHLTVFEQTPGGQCPPDVDPKVSCRSGPLAKIEPERSSHRLTYTDLKHGRIIAKLSVASGEREGYQKLALAQNEVTYWWVQLTNRNDSTKAGRSFYVRKNQSDSDLVKKEYVLRYREHPEEFKQALARFIWDPKDEKTQGSCSQGCCH